MIIGYVPHSNTAKIPAALQAAQSEWFCNFFITTKTHTVHVLCLCLSHLCFSWSPCDLSPCPVSQLQETQACLPQWPRLIPRPGEDREIQIRLKSV